MLIPIVAFSTILIGSGSCQKVDEVTTDCQSQSDCILLVIRVALALTEWITKSLIRRIFISLGSVE